MSSKTTITATGTGTTEGLQLSSATAWAVQVTSGTWGAAKIESSADGGVSYTTVRDYSDSGDIALTANRTYILRGGLKYRLNVSSYAAPITLVAQPVSN